MATPLFPTEQIDVYNEENPHKLLLMAWNLFQRRNATNAVLTAVNEKGFVMELTLAPGVFSKASKKLSAHEFEVPVKNQAEYEDYMENMFHRSNAPCVPLGLVTLWCWICFALWAVCIARIYSDGQEAEITPTKVFYGYYVVFQSSLAIFPDKTICMYCLSLLAFSHFIEAMYVAVLCITMKFGTVATLSWASLTMLAGYPVMTRVIYLDKLRLQRGIDSKSA